ncbi:MAG: DUF4238 domain-containing protein [Bacteroidetes bacterium]|nr:DUF4238 domain-containing protein [Bacteroidota bacterium]
MSRVKLEHYVPQSYLKNFSNKKEQVYVYDKGQKKHFSSNIKQIAAEGKYFHFDKHGEDNPIVNFMNEEQIIEKFFSKEIEGKYKNLLTQIKTRATMTYEPTFKLAITKDEKADLSFFLAIQMLRTKDVRQTITDATVKFLSAMYDKGDMLTRKMTSFLDDIKNTDEKTVQAGMLFDSELTESISKAISKHIWVFYINTTEDKFITSDNPIVRNGNIDDQYKSNTGLSSRGVEIAFPISSDLLLVMYEREYHAELDPCDEKFIILNDENLVLRYNLLQIHHCHKQIFGLNDLKPFICKIEVEFPRLFLGVRSKVDLFYNGKKY